ncbi:hypothetical protein LDENG_00195670, partial [Lucifuga dentata]
MCTTSSQSQSAYISLMRDIRELDFQDPFIPCDLLLIGDHSFPLAMNSQGQVLMASSLYGRGRIVVLGHEGYLTTFPALVENALTWLRGDGSDKLSVGVHRNAMSVADNLQASRFQPEVVSAFSSNLDVGVYVTDAYSVGADAKDLVAFLKGGGGVLIGGQAWHWAAVYHKENTLLDFPGNKVSGVAGIYFTENHAAVEYLPVYPEIPSSWLTVATGKDFEDDLEFLLHGMSELILEDDVVASEVLFHGSLAFPIGTNQDGQAFLAGAYYGQGRVIVVSHERLLWREILASFWKNAIYWLDEGRRGVIGVEPQLNDAFTILSKFGLKCEKTDFRKDLSVFVCTAYSDAHKEEIQDFVAEGGGLLIGGHAWYWAHTHPGQNPMTDFAGNKILNKMGLSLLKDILPVGSYKVPLPGQPIQQNYHFRHLLRRFAGHIALGESLTDHEVVHLKKLAVDCTTFLHMKAHESANYTHVMSTLMNIMKKADMPQVSASGPANSPRDRLLLQVAAEVYKICPDPDAFLPYLIKDNPSMAVVRNHVIQINVNTAGEEDWVSTGLYLSPGLRTYIVMPEEIINKGWK